MKKAAFRNAILSCFVSLFLLNCTAAQAEDDVVPEDTAAVNPSESSEMQPAAEHPLSDSSAEKPEPQTETDNAAADSSEDDITWGALFSGISQRLSGEVVIDDQNIDEDFLNALGFDGKLRSTDDVYERLVSYLHDDVLKQLLAYYGRYRDISRASNGFNGDDFFSPLHSDESLSIETKTAIMQTLLPLLMRHSMNVGDLTAARKYREIWRSYERLWPDRRLNIQCQRDDVAIKFGVMSLDSGRPFMGGMASPEFGVCSDENAEHGECLSVSERSPVCYSHLDSGTFSVFSEQLEESLQETLASLSVKDNALVAETVEELSSLLEILHHRYTFNASWNRHWDHAKWKKWLASLHVISLMLLEQHRFAELSRFERNLQAAFHGATFYQRIDQMSTLSSEMDSGFKLEYERLLSANGSLYSWVKRQFSPKYLKNLDKNFASWTKKGSSAVILPRRLIVAWTFWSEGNYAKAARIAGDVSEKKSRLVHPQLHSFQVMLKAVQGAEITREDLETYVRVIHLKSPWLVYQTLSESGRYLSKSQREMVADVMRSYSPGDASSEAARFYREYEQELRVGMDSRHLCQVDSWLETELRRTESTMGAHHRRIHWLNDLVDAEDYAGIVRLSELCINDLEDDSLVSFWRAVKCHASEDGYESCPATDIVEHCDVVGVLGHNWIRHILMCGDI